MSNQGNEAQIFDRGYRTYDGRRTGLAGAIRAVIRQSVRSILGLGRAARHKAIPVAVILLSFVPAMAVVAIVVVLPDDLSEDFVPTYAGLYGWIIAALFLFASFVAPELLCSDRRSGMLGVYLASPLDRTTYLLAKLGAIVTLLAIVTIGPPLFMLIALGLEGSGTDGWADFFVIGAKILLAGGMMSLFFAAVSMAVSSSTDRNGAATATTLGLFVGSGIIANSLVESGRSENYHLVSILGLPQELAFRLHSEPGNWVGVDTSLIWLTVIGVTVACAAWVWWRYHLMLVRR